MPATRSTIFRQANVELAVRLDRQRFRSNVVEPEDQTMCFMRHKILKRRSWNLSTHHAPSEKFFLAGWKAFCFAHSFSVVESRINFCVVITGRAKIHVMDMQIMG
jgi:hypothetical protein